MRLMALAMLLAAFPIAAQTPATSLQPFTLNYTVFRNQSELGVAELKYRQTSPGNWQLSSLTTASKGIVSAAGASVLDLSNLAVRNGNLELFSNRIETKLAWKTTVKSTALVNAGSAYRFTEAKGTKTVPYSPGLLDQHSLTLALMADLRAGKKSGILVYPIVNKGKREDNTFRIAGAQPLVTALGKLNTIRVERVRENPNGKSTRVWFASDRNFLPVMFQQVDDNGDDIEMRIIAVK